MLTNTKLLAFAASISYATLYIDSTTTIGPGQEQWEQQLPLLTPEQRLVLETKITRQQARLQSECSTNVNSASIRRIAKLSSNPAPRGIDRRAGASTSARRRTDEKR